MQCNIDARGKAVRLTLGAIAVFVSIGIAVLMLLGVLDHGAWWFIAGGLAAFGFVGIFEGWAGWCVVRAMGLKTPF